MLEKICQTIAEQLGVEVADLDRGTSFKEDLSADSLDLFELVMALEEEYGIEIAQEDMEKLKTVGDVVDYLASKDIE